MDGRLEFKTQLHVHLLRDLGQVSWVFWASVSPSAAWSPQEWKELLLYSWDKLDLVSWHGSCRQWGLRGSCRQWGPVHSAPLVWDHSWQRWFMYVATVVRAFGPCSSWDTTIGKRGTATVLFTPSAWQWHICSYLTPEAVTRPTQLQGGW